MAVSQLENICSDRASPAALEEYSSCVAQVYFNIYRLFNIYHSVVVKQWMSCMAFYPAEQGTEFAKYIFKKMNNNSII